MIFSSCRFDGLDGWYLEVFFVRSGSCRCYVWIVGYEDEHHTNGDRHDGSHPRALSVTLPVIVAWLKGRSQCLTLLYLFCMVLWWTPYHHDLWGTRSPKMLVPMSVVVIGLCGLVIHIHSHDTWWTLTPEVPVVMMAVVLCFLCSLTGRRPACAKYALCGPVTWTCERFSKTDGGWNGGISPGVFSVTVQVSVLYVIFFFGATLWAGPSDENWYICSAWSCDEPYTTMIFEGRCFRNFVWHDFSQVFLTGIATFVLCGVLMKIPPWQLQIALLVRPLFVKETQRLFHCMCFTVWLLDKHIELWRFKDTCSHTT